MLCRRVWKESWGFSIYVHLRWFFGIEQKILNRRKQSRSSLWVGGKRKSHQKSGSPQEFRTLQKRREGIRIRFSIEGNLNQSCCTLASEIRWRKRRVQSTTTKEEESWFAQHQFRRCTRCTFNPDQWECAMPSGIWERQNCVGWWLNSLDHWVLGNDEKCWRFSQRQWRMLLHRGKQKHYFAYGLYPPSAWVRRYASNCRWRFWSYLLCKPKPRVFWDLDFSQKYYLLQLVSLFL